MMQIDIEWVPLGITVTADLARSKNPRLAELLSRRLPYRSLQNHALVSGNHLYHLAPFPELIFTPAEHKEDRRQSPDGTVFLSHLQHLAIKYGPLSEWLLAAPVGRVVPEHLPLLREAGRACWEATYETKQPIEVRVTRRGQPAGAPPLPRPDLVETPIVRELVDEIHAATERIWVDPPQEILDIHRGEIASGAGSYGQYFSTMVFVNGETRPLGYCALNGLVELCHRTDLSLDRLREITPTFVKVPAEFLGYCGLDELWDFTRRMLTVLPDLRERHDYTTLVTTLALYANSLNTWNLHYFPWQHGQEHPFPQPAFYAETPS